MQRKRQRYTFVSLAGLCVGISYCDRVNISVAIVAMAEELNWSLSTQGTILGAFFYGYVVSQILGAILSSRYGGDKVLGFAALGWSILTILVPYFTSLGMNYLILNRVLLGLFEGVTFPTIYHLFALNVPKNERSRSVSVLSVNVSAGAVLAFLISPTLMTFFHWSAVFYFFGSIGIVWCFFWFLFWKGVVSEVTDLEEARAKYNFYTKRADSAEVHFNAKILLKKMLIMFEKKPIIGVIWCHFCHNIGHYVILAWLPTFLSTSLNIDKKNLSITCVPYLFISLFNLTFGYIADKMIQRRSKKIQARLKENKEEEKEHLIEDKQKPSDEAIAILSSVRRFWSCTLLSLSAFCLIILSFAVDIKGEVTFFQKSSILLLLSLALGFNAAAPVAGCDSAKLGMVEQPDVGLLQSVSNSISSLAGVIGVPLVTFVHNRYNAWGPVFFLIGVVFLCAASVFYFFGRWNRLIKLV
eukprot:maker-scaffold_5-snap-gene-8.15-mRNA-1 protein AED:0.00 eAED:0.00 QI:38/1/1/1/0.5/0.66/3/837/468